MIRQVTSSIELVCFFFLTAALSFPESDVQVVPGSVKSGSFVVRNLSGKTPVESRVLQVQVELSNHNTAILNVLMLYDPRSKLFWWQADPIPSIHQTTSISQMLPHNSLIFLTRSKFVMFWNGWGSAARILIRESSEHYSSLDEGQTNVFHVLGDKREDLQAGRFLHEYKEVAFLGLGRDFIDSKYEAVNRGLKLKDVSRVGARWQIIEESPNGGSATIVLDGKYQVIKINFSRQNE